MMFKIALVLLMVTLLGVQISNQFSIGDDRGDDDDAVAEQEWKSFKSSKSRNYNTTEESKRKTLFKKKRSAMKTHNANKANTYKKGYNQFTDKTDSEVMIVLGRRPRPKTTTAKPTTTTTASQKGKTTTRKPTTTTGKPTTTVTPSGLVDWRTDKCMPAIKDQGACGSCWAFAAIVVVEFDACVKTNTTVTLSEQQLVSCSTVNYGCNGGWQDAALKYIASAGGVATQASYPYTSGGGTTGSCKFSSSKVIGAKVSTTNPVTYIAAGDIQTIKNILAAKGLVTVDIAVVSSFMDYSSGVYTESNCASNILGYHAITVVGYGSSSGLNYWIIRNSWGTGWGQGGYILFQSGVNLCGVEDNAVATTIA